MISILKKIQLVFLLFISFNSLFAWAEIGHRVVGEVAFRNVKHKTIRKINKLVNYESLASLSTFGDDIKSDDRYKKFYAWHYVDFEVGKKYEDCKPNPDGDLVKAIEFCTQVLKNKNSSNEDKAFYLKLLIHFIGDLHQPLHVGQESDKGGNDIKVKWFGQQSNLHRVWDEDIINKYNMSYTELASNLPYKNKEEIAQIGKGSIMDWVYESQNLATKVYSTAKIDEGLSYKYQYENLPMVKLQLQKAGYRLAKILDEIFS